MHRQHHWNHTSGWFVCAGLGSSTQGVGKDKGRAEQRCSKSGWWVILEADQAQERVGYNSIHCIGQQAFGGERILIPLVGFTASQGAMVHTLGTTTLGNQPSDSILLLIYGAEIWS